MRKIPVYDLLPGTKFTKSVYLDKDTVLVGSKQPITQQDLDRLKQFGISFVLTDGEVLTGIEDEKTGGSGGARAPSIRHVSQSDTAPTALSPACSSGVTTQTTVGVTACSMVTDRSLADAVPFRAVAGLRACQLGTACELYTGSQDVQEKGDEQRQ